MSSFHSFNKNVAIRRIKVKTQYDLVTLPALEASLSQTLIQTLAERSSSDLRMEFSSDSAVPVSLESGVGASSRRE